MSVQIVIARVIVDVEVARPYAHDLGERPPLREVKRAQAAMWLISGSETDVDRARAFCRLEPEWSVYTFPPTEAEPLEAAKRLALQEVPR